MRVGVGGRVVGRRGVGNCERVEVGGGVKGGPGWPASRVKSRQ